MNENLWNQPDVPHKGWTWVSIDDTEEAEAVCDMCGQTGVRYLHTVTHPLIDRPFRVGRVCAEKMTEDYAKPKKQETRLKGREKRWQAFQNKHWYKVKLPVDTEPLWYETRYHGLVLRLYRMQRSGVTYWRGDTFPASGKAPILVASLDEAKRRAFLLVEEMEGREHG